ncbi:ABC-2 family transporter protein [Paenibacillus beijingensis]
MLTFIIPYAFVNYYPAAYLLNKNETSSYLYLGAPAIGIVMFIIAYLFWFTGIRSYKGTGS